MCGLIVIVSRLAHSLFFKAKKILFFKACFWLAAAGVATLTSCTDKIKIEMVFVQGGTFTMGSPDGVGNYDEHPAHQVSLGNFSIGKYEVTQGQWKAVMNGNNPSSFKSVDNADNTPVQNVSWADVQTFIGRLNALTGKNYRLPTEAEWEYAARGGNKSKGYLYSGSNAIDDVAWYYCGNTRPVGIKAPNELGIYDMSGNVWELCSDWYGNYSSSSQTDPQGPSSGSYRVNRGGSWYNNASGCRITERGKSSTGYGASIVGFRLVLKKGE